MPCVAVSGPPLLNRVASCPVSRPFALIVLLGAMPVLLMIPGRPPLRFPDLVGPRLDPVYPVDRRDGPVPQAHVIGLPGLRQLHDEARKIRSSFGMGMRNTHQFDSAFISTVDRRDSIGAERVPHLVFSEAIACSSPTVLAKRESFQAVFRKLITRGDGLHFPLLFISRDEREFRSGGPMGSAAKPTRMTAK